MIRNHHTLPDRTKTDSTTQPVHPSCFTFYIFIFLVLLSVFGAMIGIHLISTLGITPNTSIVGAMVAIIIARIPLQMFVRFRSIHIQNLAQSAISSATFGAANSLLLPIGIPYLLGRPDLVMPMFIGVSLAMFLDGYLLYRMFNTTVFPATGAWPPGVATAEAIKAGDKGGIQARILGAGIAIGAIGSWFRLPMAAMGITFIGNTLTISIFGAGLLLSSYSIPLFGVDINRHYIPHGMMIGAGLVALCQIIAIISKNIINPANLSSDNENDRRVLSSLGLGSAGYMAIATLIALISGLYSQLSIGMLLSFVLYAAGAAFIHELIVGLAAIHSGWFPAFAVAFITLIIGMIIGFPPVALALLCGLSVSTGPAFADMGYDLKAGFILRSNNTDVIFELQGRRQQFFASVIAFVIAIPVVWFSYHDYFINDLIPPVAKVYVTTIQSGISQDIVKPLLIWALLGALIQLIGRSKFQLGVLFSTGLIIANPFAGWAVLTGIAIKWIVLKACGEKVRSRMEVFGAGIITGDTLFSFFNSLLTSHRDGK